MSASCQSILAVISPPFSHLTSPTSFSSPLYMWVRVGRGRLFVIIIYGCECEVSRAVCVCVCGEMEELGEGGLLERDGRERWVVINFNHWE